MQQIGIIKEQHLATAVHYEWLLLNEQSEDARHVITESSISSLAFLSLLSRRCSTILRAPCSLEQHLENTSTYACCTYIYIYIANKKSDLATNFMRWYRIIRPVHVSRFKGRLNRKKFGKTFRSDHVNSAISRYRIYSSFSKHACV